MGKVMRARPNLWRLGLANAVLLVLVFIFLAASPAPVTFPTSHWEVILLGIAAAVMLAMNLLITEAEVGADVRRGRRAETDSDALAGLREFEHFNVVARDGTIGIVAQVLGDRDGEPVGLLVEDGWWGSRRFFVPLDAVRRVDSKTREIHVETTATSV